MGTADRVIFQFGGFCLDASNRQLTRNGEAVHLEPKSFDVLQHLAENAGRLVTKEDLVTAVWARAFVSDNSLTRCIHQVRSALQDNADAPAFIETVAGSGYRFIADIEQVDVVAAETGGQSVVLRRKPIVALALLVFAAVVIWAAWLGIRPQPPHVERIAVLPLVNLTGEPSQEYFVQGVHDALIAELSKAAAVDVISRTSVMMFRGSDLQITEIAEQLDVDAVVEGSVLRAGDKLTVTAQLIATRPERHLWAERYHRDVSELFEIATEIVDSIAAEIALELSPRQDTPLATQYADSQEAYDAYLLGRFHLEQRSPEGYRLAQQNFRRAIEVDAGFAPAYAGLAHTFGSAAIFGAIRPRVGFPEVRRLAEKAIELDDQLAESQLLLAGVEFYWDWDWDEAERLGQHALDLNPNLANAYRFLAEVYSVTGRNDEAQVAIERCREIDPLPPTSQFKPALILYLARDYEEAIHRSEEALRYYPEFWQGHWLLCISLSAMNKHEAATSACESAADYSKGAAMALGILGQVKAMSGDAEGALKIATELEAQSETRYVSPASIALIYGALDRPDDAFVWLERAYAERDQQLIHAGNAAYFDQLRSDSRFETLRRTALQGKPDA